MVQLTKRRKVLGGVAGLVGLAACFGGADDENNSGDAASGNGGGNGGGNGNGGGGTSTAAESDPGTESVTEQTGESTPESTPEPTATPEPQNDADVTILEHELDTSEMFASVSGKVKNTSGANQDYIEVQGYAYNDADERIDDGLWNATEVQKDTVLTFEVTFISAEPSEIARYELTADASPF